MWQLIIVSTIVTVFTIACIFFCGAYWHAAKDEGFNLFEGDAIWLFIVTAVCIGLAIMCWAETGKARVKTSTLHIIERRVTLKEQGGEIKSDTLYIFKFR